MKIRQGFISNSSSSSFIIGNETDKEKILKDVKAMMKRYKNRRVKEIKKHFEENPYNWTPEKLEEELQRSIVMVEGRYSDEWLDAYVHVDTIKDCSEKVDLDYWHAGCYLAYPNELVIYDDMDNYIPEKVAEKIVKKYYVKSACTHMG